MCVLCDLLCDAVWCVLVFVARVCVVCLSVWFDCDVLCGGVWYVGFTCLCRRVFVCMCCSKCVCFVVMYGLMLSGRG